jgi:hypothetical protein
MLLGLLIQHIHAKRRIFLALRRVAVVKRGGADSLDGAVMMRWSTKERGVQRHPDRDNSGTSRVAAAILLLGDSP